MPRANRDLQVFTNDDISGPLVFTYKLNANFGFFLQFVWTSLVGNSEATIWGSYNGANWSQRTLRNNKGKIVDSLPISGANDNGAIELNHFRGDFIQIRVSAATSGTITAYMNIQETQNTY